MWCFFLLLVLVLVPFSSPCFAQVLLNEVYYDHPGRDDDREFVELVNTGPSPVALTGYALEFHDGASPGWSVMWRAGATDSVGAAGLFVIGGHLVWPVPDAVTGLRMQNGPDAVRLTVDGVVLDRLGYGELEDGESYEGQSAEDVAEGRSLARIPDGFDSDNNAFDFRPSDPTPGRFNVASRDAGLALAPETPARAAFPQGAREVLAIRVGNFGTEVVSAGAISVALVDSSARFESLLDSVANNSSIDPGGYEDVVFSIALSAGYHRLAVRANYAGDERPANDSLVLSRRYGGPSLLVSEVMSHPGEGCPEYIELLNADSSPLDIGGYFFRDRARGPVEITGGEWWLGPGGYMVLTPDELALARCFSRVDLNAVVEVVSAWPSLNHSGNGDEADSIIVLDRFVLPVERVAYPPQPSDTRGTSVERIDLYAHVGRHTWALSAAPQGGTPGWGSEGAVLQRPRVGSISVAPNPFVPSAGEKMLVTVAERPVHTRAVALLYDIRGRRLREIGVTAELPFVFVWDGTDGDGRLVSPGIYIVACELYAIATGVRSVEKVVVGCAARNP